VGAYTVPAGHVGVYAKALVASTVDTVTFTATDVAAVNIITDGAAAIYVTFDGTTPTVAGTATWLVPATAGRYSFAPHTAGATVVKLISSGTPTYSCARAAV